MSKFAERQNRKNCAAHVRERGGAGDESERVHGEDQADVSGPHCPLKPQ